MSRTGPRRSESVRLAVLNAADDLLVERGFNGVTIEGIAARAGVAKQTVYRWWRSKVDILLEAVADDAREGLAWRPGSGPAADQLARQLRRVAAFLREPAGRVLLALLGHAQTDPATAEALHETFLRGQRDRDIEGLRTVLEHHTGRRVDDETAARLLDVLLGPVYYAELVLGRPADEDVLTATVRTVLADDKA